MLIPKGSTIYIPTWAIHHSDRYFENGDSFNPDRYTGYVKLANDYAGSPDWEKRDHYGYGAGRRICPGIHMAERSMWRTAAKLLWAFDISQAIDPKTGLPIPIDTQAYTPGIAQFPMPFQVRMTPRSEARMATIRKEKHHALQFMEPYE